MTCDEVKELMIDHIEGELSRRMDREISEHIKTCRVCREEREQTESLLYSVSESVPDPGDGYFANIYPRIIQRLENEAPIPWYKQLFVGWFSQNRQFGQFFAPLVIALVFTAAILLPMMVSEKKLGPTGAEIATNVSTLKMSMSTAAPVDSSAGAELAELSETEMDDLQDALLAAMEDVLHDKSKIKEYPLTAGAGKETKVWPELLSDMEPDELGTVIEKLSEDNENNI